MKGDRGIRVHELGNTYLGDEDRFVVSLIVGYSERDMNDGEHPLTPEAAAALALDLTTDGSCGETHWYVYDRKTGILHQLEQRAFDPEFEEFREEEEDGDQD